MVSRIKILYISHRSCINLASKLVRNGKNISRKISHLEALEKSQSVFSQNPIEMVRGQPLLFTVQVLFTDYYTFNDGAGQHNGKGQNGDGRHDDGDGRHNDGKGQQGNRQHNDGDGRYNNVA